MSADNYVIVRKFADGWRWAEGFASCDEPTDDKFQDNGPFSSPWDAQDAALESVVCGPEYGVEIERPDEPTGTRLPVIMVGDEDLPGVREPVLCVGGPYDGRTVSVRLCVGEFPVRSSAFPDYIYRRKRLGPALSVFAHPTLNREDVSRLLLEGYRGKHDRAE